MLLVECDPCLYVEEAEEVKVGEGGGGGGGKGSDPGGRVESGLERPKGWRPYICGESWWNDLTRCKRIS